MLNIIPFQEKCKSLIINYINRKKIFNQKFTEEVNTLIVSFSFSSKVSYFGYIYFSMLHFSEKRKLLLGTIIYLLELDFYIAMSKHKNHQYISSILFSLINNIIINDIKIEEYKKINLLSSLEKYKAIYYFNAIHMIKINTNKKSIDIFRKIHLIFDSLFLIVIETGDIVKKINISLSQSYKFYTKTTSNILVNDFLNCNYDLQKNLFLQLEDITNKIETQTFGYKKILHQYTSFLSDLIFTSQEIALINERD